MIKKSLIFALSTVIALSLLLTGCGEKDAYSGVNPEDYVKVGKYKGLPKIEVKDNHKVTEQEVDQEVQKLVQRNTKTKELKSGKAKKGDEVNIDYSGKVDGKKFDGGTAQKQDLILGSNSMIPGFEEQIAGMKVGETKTIKVTFPKKYQDKKLAGKKADFEIKLNSIKTGEQPKFDKEFFKEAGYDVETEKEFRSEVKKKLKLVNKYRILDQQKSIMWDNVVKNSTMLKDDKKNEKYPEAEIKRVVNIAKRFYEDQAKQAKLSLEEFVKKSFNGMDMKVFETQLEITAKPVVKEELIALYIAKKEKIEFTDKDYQEFIQGIYDRNGVTEKFYKENNDGKTIEEKQGKPFLKISGIKDKVQTFIYEKGKVKK